MKTLRKNVDLSNETVSILIMEGALNGFGSLKPFLEKTLNDAAKKAIMKRPELYKKLVTENTKRNIKTGLKRK